MLVKMLSMNSEMVKVLKSESSNGATMSEDELFSNMYSLFIAGHETTATALSWLVYEILIHPEIQRKMYQETRKIIFSQEFLLQLLKTLTNFNMLIML